MWWDQSHDVQSPVKLNCSFDEASCSSLSLSETMFSDCFPPATQSPHHTELLQKPAELHDADLPKLSSMATALPDVYSLVPPDLQLYEDEEKTATVTAIAWLTSGGSSVE